MEQQFDAILTGSDSPVEGIATQIEIGGYSEAWEFNSIDETLHLVIARDTHGRWMRIEGSEPYLSGWTGELAEQIANQ